ncbi:MAG: hypothetical protein FDZ72_07860 [Betaproteobacteria bacterium]|nr:MAG: hypothetical protein FDZ72_07860 [Betaproteobacteria bacterium]
MNTPIWLRSGLQRYQALRRRERMLVAVSTLVVVLVGGNALFVAPKKSLTEASSQRLTVVQAELASVGQQLRGMGGVGQDPDAEVKRDLAHIRRTLADIDTQLAQTQSALVPPEQMVGFLENILVRSRGLRLVNMRTLPISGVLDASKDGVAKSGTAAASASAAGTGREMEHLFRHGVELTIEGAYPELLAYLAEVERSPQRLLWSRAQLSVEQHPRAVLKLTVYTLSLDRKWLVI